MGTPKDKGERKDEVNRVMPAGSARICRTRRSRPNHGSQGQKNTAIEGQNNAGELQGGGHSGKKPVVVWVKSGEKIHRTRIATGAVDGSNAEVKWGLKEGDEVILSMSLPGKSASAATAAPANKSLSCHSVLVPHDDRNRKIFMKTLIEIIKLRKDYHVGDVTSSCP